MAIDFIPINMTSAQGPLLKNYTQALRTDGSLGAMDGRFKNTDCKTITEKVG